MVERVEIEKRTGRIKRFRPARRKIRQKFDPVSEAVTRLSDGMSTLVRGHLQLARVEMAQDIRAIAKDVVIGAGGAPLLMVGYLLLWVSLGFLLALVMQPWVAFLICAGVNLIAGAVMLLYGVRKAKKDKLALPASSSEFKRDKDWLTTLREPTEQLRGHVH